MVLFRLASPPGGLGHHHVVELELPLALGASELGTVSGSHRAVGPLFEDVDAVSGHFGLSSRNRVEVGLFLISSLWRGLGCDEERALVLWPLFDES